MFVAENLSRWTLCLKIKKHFDTEVILQQPRAQVLYFYSTTTMKSEFHCFRESYASTQIIFCPIREDCLPRSISPVLYTL